VRPGSAELKLVRELSGLFRDEDIDRHSPVDHQALFKSAASVELPEVSWELLAREDVGDRLATISEAAVSETLAQSLLETLARQGSRDGFEPVLRRVEALYRSLLRASEVSQPVAIAESLRELRARASSKLEARLAETMARLASGDSIPLLVDALARAGREAPALVRRLGDALGAVVINNLLLALSVEQDRAHRRRIFDTLTALGPSIIDHVKLLLDDSRWYVLRNMIALARAVGDRTTLPQVRQLAGHPDLRVKLEAIKSLLRLDKNVPPDLLEVVIASPDPKVAEAAVTLVGDYGIAEGLEPLLALLKPSDLRGRRRATRVSALRALGELGDPAALARLDRFFKESWWWGISAEERCAAFESLAGYPAEARQPMVERGLRSRAPAIRAICARFAHEDAGASGRAGSP
jgi:HEAT repeat protein